MKQVKSITVVGAGTAGLIAALILKSRSSIKVDLIYSSNIPIIGVGEGSTDAFSHFMHFLEITPTQIIKECDATFKIGIMFDDWIKNDRYIHTVTNNFSNQYGQYCHIYAKQIEKNSKHLFESYITKNLVESYIVNDFDNNAPTSQYHFNTFKLNEFLKTVAKKNNINIIDDDIVDVSLDEFGNIDEIYGKKKKYKSDFYIDSTGFKRILMNKLNVKWISFGKHLKMKSAITFQTKDEDNYNYWTLAKAMNAGWRFKIPTWGRHGNGYIYDSDFITAEQAKLEIEKDLGYEVEVGKNFNFDPGMLENVWVKNCVAIGLSGSFFEPLEATSIGSSIQQSFLLMHKIQNYDENVIKDYNKSYKNIVNNIKDFIILHYITKRKDTDFWKNILKTEIPDSLKYNLERWKTKLPIEEDFCGDSNYKLFGARNYIMVMAGLNLFNNKAIGQEYSFLANNLKNNTELQIKKIIDNENNTSFITHKQAIEIIRNS